MILLEILAWLLTYFVLAYVGLKSEDSRSFLMIMYAGMFIYMPLVRLPVWLNG